MLTPAPDMQAKFQIVIAEQQCSILQDMQAEASILFRGQLWDAYEERGGQDPSPGTCIVCNTCHDLAQCTRVADLADRYPPCSRGLADVCWTSGLAECAGLQQLPNLLAVSRAMRSAAHVLDKISAAVPYFFS